MYNPTMKTVLITGTNRGIGLATTKKFLKEGYFVIATTRSGKHEVKDDNLAVYELDLTDPKSIESFTKQVCNKHKGIDILINNAAVSLDSSDYKIDLGILKETLEVNLFGQISLTQNLLDCITKGGHIINVSSIMGSLNNTTEGHAPAYRISKTALNMFTRVLAPRVAKKNITVSSIHPGWVKTRMGGRGAPREPEEAADDIFDLAISNVETGQFWFKGKSMEW
jgi:NAD(P)-dependent dehydrogenase (short-subunit alcohol dehydrogenase family)